MSILYRGLSKDVSYQVSIHLAKWFQRRRFFTNQPFRNKNCLWRPCLLTERDEMSNLYRGHAIDASYQVSVHLAKRFQRKRFLKIGQSETRIAYIWWPCLLIHILPTKFHFIWLRYKVLNNSLQVLLGKVI